MEAEKEADYFYSTLYKETGASERLNYGSDNLLTILCWALNDDDVMMMIIIVVVVNSIIIITIIIFIIYIIINILIIISSGDNCWLFLVFLNLFLLLCSQLPPTQTLLVCEDIISPMHNI